MVQVASIDSHASTFGARLTDMRGLSAVAVQSTAKRTIHKLVYVTGSLAWTPLGDTRITQLVE